MLKIYFDCQVQHTNTIKRELTLYFCDIQFVNEYHNEKMIIIKEIHENHDLKKIRLQDLYKYIFLIENGEYMFELLEYEPLAFIRVQHIEKDLPKVITMLQFENKGIGIMLDFKSGYQKIRIDAQNIEYIESYGHYLFIHTLSATFKVREKISDIFKKLESLNFIQVHKSYIVNKQYIRQQNTKELILASQTHIPLGNNYKKKL